MKNFVYYDTQCHKGGITDEEKEWATSACYPLCKTESEKDAQMLVRGLEVFRQDVLNQARFTVENCLKEIVKELRK